LSSSLLIRGSLAALRQDFHLTNCLNLAGHLFPAKLPAFTAERAGSKKTVTIEGASYAVMLSHADAVAELIEQAAVTVGGDGGAAPP
jgi:hypothetical protein